MRLKKSLSMVLCIVLALSLLPAGALAESFLDMPDDWSTQALERAVGNGLISGFEDRTIRPKDNLTRAQMATVVNKAFNAYGLVQRILFN